ESPPERKLPVFSSSKVSIGPWELDGHEANHRDIRSETSHYGQTWQDVSGIQFPPPPQPPPTMLSLSTSHVFDHAIFLCFSTNNEGPPSHNNPHLHHRRPRRANDGDERGYSMPAPSLSQARLDSEAADPPPGPPPPPHRKPDMPPSPPVPQPPPPPPQGKPRMPSSPPHPKAPSPPPHPKAPSPPSPPHPLRKPHMPSYPSPPHPPRLSYPSPPPPPPLPLPPTLSGTDCGCNEEKPAVM
ncbi:hypothetical protein L249_0772, partial [Ophiocordyceps polyrhachis-furcata BCC 54312]